MTRIDNHFRDRSWDEMRKVLDEEMPQIHAEEKGKKRFLLLLAFLFVGFVSGVGTMLYFNQGQDPAFPIVEKTKAEIAGVSNVSELKIAPENIQPVNVNSIKIKEPVAENSDFKTTNVKTIVKEVKPFLEVAVIGNKLSTALIDDETNQNEIVLGSKQNELANQNADILQIEPTVSMLPFENINSKTITAEYSQPIEKFDSPKIPKDKKWAFGVTIGAYSNTNRILAGMSFGSKATYKLDNRFVLGGGIQYSILSGYKKGVIFSKADELSPAFANDLDSNSVSTIEGSFDQYVQAQPENKNLPISSLHYIELPFEIAYRFSDKFQIHLGIKTGYLVNVNADEVLRTANTILTSNRSVDQDLQNGLKKIDFATTIGLGFYPTKNIGIDLQYNHGMTDITKDEVWLQHAVNSNKNLQLSAIYFFGK